MVVDLTLFVMTKTSLVPDAAKYVNIDLIDLIEISLISAINRKE